MTTKAELVAQVPALAHGFEVNLDYGGGGFRAAVEIADLKQAASIEWHDITSQVSSIQWRFGSTAPRGDAQGFSGDLMLWADGDQYAPWREDNSDVFGVHVPLGPNLLIRFGLFRDLGGASIQWFPQFTMRVLDWADASLAAGNLRMHRISAIDLWSSIANKPVGARVEQGHRARIDSLITDSGWEYGHDVYGAVTTDGATPALTYPVRAAAAAALAELRAACRPAGLVVRSRKDGTLIAHPAPRDTWNAAVLAGVGATGTVWTNPILGYYFAGPQFTYDPVVLGEIAYWPEFGGSSFGISANWEHIVNELTVSSPAGLYSFDDPISASDFDNRSMARETWLAANNIAVQDIVNERAFTEYIATPLRFGVELPGGFPAIALIDHLDPVTIKHTTRPGRVVVTASGQVRGMTHDFVLHGADETGVCRVQWRAVTQVDLDQRSTASPLLPVENLTLVDVDGDSAEFSWTNPVQVIVPTVTQIRIADTNEWTDIPYPTTGVVWLGLRAATAYRFEVRLLREVDGVVEAVSPARDISFTTDVAIDGDGDGVVVPDPGPCLVDLKLESSPDTITWTLEATYLDIYDDVVDGVWTPPPFSFTDQWYRWCYREVCAGVPGAWTCAPPFAGVCATPSILGTAPYDDAVAFVPKVCGLEVREALSDTVGVTGSAFGGFGVDDAGNQALTSAAEGTVAYGVAEQLLDLPGQSATIGIRVKLGTSPVGIVRLFQAAGLELQASDNGAGFSVAGKLYRADGGTTTITDTTVLPLGTATDIFFTHNVSTGALKLYVDAVEVESGSYIGARRPFLQVWTVQLPDDSIASNAGVWDRALAVTELPGYVAFSPDDLSDLVAWYDASDAASITSSGGLVSQWDDKSGNARHLTSSGSNRPDTGLNTIGGLNVISTTASKFMSFSPPVPVLTNDMSLYVVFKKTGAANSFEAAPFTLSLSNIGLPFDRYSNTAFGHLWNIQGAAGSAYIDLRTLTSACQMSWIGDKDGISSGTHILAEYKDGSLFKSNNVTGTWSNGHFFLGRRADGATQFTGDIAEIILYNAAHDATDRAAVEAYLRAKWGTP